MDSFLNDSDRTQLRRPELQVDAKARAFELLGSIYPELTDSDKTALVLRLINAVKTANTNGLESSHLKHAASPSGESDIELGEVEPLCVEEGETNSVQLNGAVHSYVDESEIMLITYADSIVSDESVKAAPALGAGSPSALQVLSQICDEHIGEAISTIHILPFFPASSDGGFAVVDYYQVAEKNGTWADVTALKERYKLMFDVVCNHGSAQSEWFKQFLEGQEPGVNYYLRVAPDADVSAVVRPRTHDLRMPFETVNGTEYVWATFSQDQVDFDFTNPDVLVEFAAILGNYAKHGASRIRLDAIAYLWKQAHSSCIHLPQTHAIVKLMRLLMAIVDSQSLVITETNVPHSQNVSYFGESDEAHVVYNFTLAPLIIWSLISQDASELSTWLKQLEECPPDCTYLNFLASHDGIGLRPVEGILSDAQVDTLIVAAEQVNGRWSGFSTPNGVRPYELNVSLADLLAGTEATGIDANRFLTAHAVLVTLAGIPAIYVHSLLVSSGAPEAVESLGNRAINRKRLTKTEAEEHFNTGWRAEASSRLRNLLALRRQIPAFNPNAKQQIIGTLFEGSVLVIKRDARPSNGSQLSDQSQPSAQPERLNTVVALFNVSDTVQRVERDPSWPQTFISFKDAGFNPNEQPPVELLQCAETIELDPYSWIWLSC